MSHPNVISSWILGLFTYHKKGGEVLSNLLCIVHPYNPSDVSAVQHNFFMLITVNKVWSNHVVYDYIVLFIISIELQELSTSNFHGYSNFLTRRLVTSVEFSKAPSSLTITRLYVWVSFFNNFSMKQIILTGGCLDEVRNIQSILVFAYTIVIMELKPWT